MTDDNAPLNGEVGEDIEAGRFKNGSTHKEPTKSARRSALRALVQDFSPVWFTYSMNLGILSLLMHQLPYQFRGLGIISTIFFVLDLVVFVLCSIAMSIRFITYKQQAAHEIAADVNELCFMACWPISWMTLTSLTALIVSKAGWGGYAFTIVAYVMWWIAVAWTLVTTFAVYVTLTRRKLTEAQSLSLAVILPAVANATTAAEGGFISIYSAGISSRLAIPVIICSFMLVGIGMWLATLIYALFLERILKTGWLDAVKRPTLMIAVGPMGQSSTALLALATAAKLHFGDFNKGTFLVAETVSGLHAACVLLSLMMFGFGVFWLLYAICGLLAGAFKNELTWSPAWFATIFPVGTMGSALILLSEEMDSPAFRVLAAGLLIILVLNLSINVGYTARAIWQGKILVVREDPRCKKKS